MTAVRKRAWAQIPDDLALYVDAAGDDNATGSINYPLATLDEAIKRATQTSWTRSAAIWIGAGTFATANINQCYRIPAGAGPDALPLEIIGTLVDSGLGVQTVTSAANGTQIVGAELTVSAAAYAVDAYRGYQYRFLSGTSSDALHRSARMVATNSSTVITQAGAAGSGAAGDTLVLEKPGTVISCASVTGSDGIVRWPGFTGAQVVLRNVELRSTSIVMIGCTVIGECVWITPNITSTSFVTYVTIDGKLISGAAFSLIPGCGSRIADVPFSLYACNGVGFYFNAGALAPGQCTLFVTEGSFALVSASVFSGVQTNCRHGGAAELFSNYFVGDSAVGVYRGGYVAIENSVFTGVTPRSGAAIHVQDGAVLWIDHCAINDTTSGGDAIRLFAGAKGAGNNIVGTGNGGVGITVLSDAKFNATDTNTTTTVTGTGGDTQIGALASPTSWASIAAAGAAGINDLANPVTSQMCRVGP